MSSNACNDQNILLECIDAPVTSIPLLNFVKCIFIQALWFNDMETSPIFHTQFFGSYVIYDFRLSYLFLDMRQLKTFFTCLFQVFFFAYFGDIVLYIIIYSPSKMDSFRDKDSTKLILHGWNLWLSQRKGTYKKFHKIGVPIPTEGLVLQHQMISLIELNSSGPRMTT